MRVTIGQYFESIHDVDDGFGGTTGAYREYTLPPDIFKFRIRRMDRWTHQDRSTSSS